VKPKERTTLKGIERHLSHRDMMVYWKREKLEEEYQQKCGKFIEQLEMEKKRRIKGGDRKRGKGGRRHQSEKLLRKELLQKMDEEHKKKKVEFYNKKKMSKGLLKIAQDPKRFFKDVIGEKKSIFAQNLSSVKKYLKNEIRRKTNIYDKELRKMDKDGSKREGMVINSQNENTMRK
jgi:hypothetical protein